MSKLIVHKFVSILIVVLMLLPVGIQLIHTIENHEHVVCNSKELQHIHEKELDCSLCLVKLNKEPFALANLRSLGILTFHFESPTTEPRVKTSTRNPFKASRAPPQLII